MTVGVEVGVLHGHFALVTLAQWERCEKYYLIDPYRHQNNYLDAANKDNLTQEVIYQNAILTLAPFREKVEWLRMLSEEAVKFIPDDSVDFVYIDARHDYCAVTEDLELFWPKLRVGGIMAGHDYLTNAELQQISDGQDWSVCSDGELSLFLSIYHHLLFLYEVHRF